MMQNQQSLSELVSRIKKCENATELTNILNTISNLGYEQGLQSMKMEKYVEAIEAYNLISEAYLEATHLINKSTKLTELKSLSSTMLETAKYWHKHAESFLQDAINTLLEKARSLQSLGKYDESIKYFQEALNLIETTSYSPQEKSSVLADMGISFLYKPDPTNAKDYFEKATQIDHNNPFAWNGIGYISESQGDYERALEYYSKAAEMNPQESIFIGNKGGVLYVLRKYPEALEAIDKAIELDPDNDTALVNKAAIFMDEKSDLAKAEEYLQRALTLTPNSLYAKSNLAEIQFIRGKYYECLKLAREAFVQSRLSQNDRKIVIVIQFLIAASYYAQNRKVDGKREILGLLNYYESLPKPFINSWNYENIGRSINESTSFSANDRRLLTNMISYLTAEEKEKQEIATTIKNQLESDKQIKSFSSRLQRLFSGKYNIQRDDIKVVNTYYPDPHREGWYFWEIHLESPSESREKILSSIDHVEYTLDPTFRDPVHKVNTSNDGFQLKGHGWGEFEIKVRIFFTDQEVKEKNHWLELGPTPFDR